LEEVAAADDRGVRHALGAGHAREDGPVGAGGDGIAIAEGTREPTFDQSTNQ